MKYINNWKANAKKNNKIDIVIRIGKITFITLWVDTSAKKFILTVLNFTVKN